MKLQYILLATAICFSTTIPVQAKSSGSNDGQSPTAIAQAQPREATANRTELPTQILKTGINLNSSEVSPNSLQLSNTIGLTNVLEQIQQLRLRAESTSNRESMEYLAARQDLYDATDKALSLIQRTDLEIEFAAAEIEAEQQVYQEILNTFTSDRDKAIARTNAIGFISNGALWAVCEALAIPSYKFAKFAIPSGIVGIPAGVVPSLASMYTFKQMSGKKRTSEVEPNMLAKLFDYPTNPEIEYPHSIWEFLHQVPATEPKGKTRLEQMVDRWIADANMPGFTDRKSKAQLDAITASLAQKKGLSISTLTARTVMLQQLHAEIWKMKRLLLELTMAVQNEKQLISSTTGDGNSSSRSTEENEPKLR